jgi:cation:H+ antiporter
MILIDIALVIIGFLLLIKGSDYMVDGASSIARRLRVSQVIIGLTIVAMGTSAPELVVSLFSSLTGSAQVAVGNIMGSTIANVLLIGGVAAMVHPLTMKENTVWRELPYSLLAVLAMGLLANDQLFDGVGESMLTRSDGLVLLLFFLVFLNYLFVTAHNDRKRNTIHVDEIEAMSYMKSFLLVVVGITGLILGGQITIQGAVGIAELFGLSQNLIGLTIIAVGTSLPELVASIVASRKGNTDIAIGNIVGSNIFNILWTLGLTSLITPIAFTPDNSLDISFAMMAILLMFTLLWNGERHKIDRWQGSILLFVYISYLGYVIVRG